MLNTEYVSSIKKNYPVGAVIEVDHMSDSFHPIPKGTRGIVRLVDDIGQIHVNWDNHRSLALVPQEDTFHLCLDDARNINVVVDPNVSFDYDLNICFTQYTIRNVAKDSDLCTGLFVFEEEEYLEANHLCDIASDKLYDDLSSFLNLSLIKDTPYWLQFMVKCLIDSDNNIAFSSDNDEIQEYLINNSDEILQYLTTSNLLDKGLVGVDETDDFNIVVYPMILNEYNLIGWDQNYDILSHLTPPLTNDYEI